MRISLGGIDYEITDELGAYLAHLNAESQRLRDRASYLTTSLNDERKKYQARTGNKVPDTPPSSRPKNTPELPYVGLAPGTEDTFLIEFREPKPSYRAKVRIVSGNTTPEEIVILLTAEIRKRIQDVEDWRQAVAHIEDMIATVTNTP